MIRNDKKKELETGPLKRGHKIHFKGKGARLKAPRQGGWGERDSETEAVSRRQGEGKRTRLCQGGGRGKMGINEH